MLTHLLSVWMSVYILSLIFDCRFYYFVVSALCLVLIGGCLVLSSIRSVGCMEHLIMC